MPPFQPQTPPQESYAPYSPERTAFDKPTLWLVIGGAALLVVIAVAVFFGGSFGQTDAERKAEILRSLSAPSNAPQITAEEKQQILNSLSAPSNAPVVSAEEKQAILNSLSSPPR